MCQESFFFCDVAKYYWTICGRPCPWELNVFVQKKNSEWECYYCIFKWMLHAITFLASDWTPLVFLFWLSQDVLGVDCHHRNNCSVDYKGNCITILPSHHIFLADDNKFILVLPLSSSFLWSDQEVKFYLPLGCICEKT